MAQTETDLLGNALTASEQELLRVYESLKKLAERDDLPPSAARNAARLMRRGPCGAAPATVRLVA